ncbi:TPA: HAMP domain-containing histidine kinase, partial [Clostridioides difficile]|nr:HAMP domain-containing histidine kinase [Clostridioides difficile]
NRYYRGSNTKQKIEGTGLGLAITKQIIEVHGGNISVESIPGLGSSFYITFPI